MGNQRKVAVVVSHPRSGTHLTIDFLRRNFSSFDLPLNLAESADELYVNADRPDWPARLERALTRWPTRNLIVQSHRAALHPGEQDRLAIELKRFQTVYLYPFRQISQTLRSFAEFSAYRGDLRNWPKTEDRFFGAEGSVGDCLEAHALSGSELYHPMDMDALLAEPGAACRRLADLLDERPRELARRAPHKKVGSSRLAELVERLRGRESTAVVAPRGPEPPAEQLRFLDERFRPLHDLLRRRAEAHNSTA